MARPFAIAISLQTLAMTIGCAKPQPAARPNVLLITIDTFRADRLGTGIAPAIDRLAATGIRFTAARSAVPLTLPSHTTIHTGLLPPAHGVRENGVDTLAATHQTLAALLKSAGYETAAFVGAFVLDHRFGLAQGFDNYDDHIPRDPGASDRLEAERPASAVVDRVLEWLEQRSPDPKGPGLPPPTLQSQAPSLKSQAPSPQPPAPFFLWIHLYDPHAPYTPPKEFLVPGRTPYDGEIAYADSQLARVLEALRVRALSDRTIIVVAGDHGEGLGDHGERTHGMLLYDSTLRVPLIIAAPGQSAATRDEAVSLADLAPTILRAVGIGPPAAMTGRSLLDPVRPKADVDLYSETEYPRVAGWSPVQALTDGRWKTIRAGTSTEVYDVGTDPREEHDVSASQGTIAAAMTPRMEAIHASAAAASARTISPDAQERLRSLGYVASSAQSRPAADAPSPATRIATWNEFEDALSALAGHVPDAQAALRRLAAANPDAPVIQNTYARALKEGGQADAALAVYRQAAKRWPTDAVLLHDLAVAAREAAGTAKGAVAKALHDEAIRADQAAVALEPDSPATLNGLGLLAIDEGKTHDAIEAFERAAALDSNNASYWANLGNARRAGGDRAGAEQAYRRALEVDARTADAANGLGVLLVEASRPADAAPWFERAIAAAPDLVEARLNLGIALQGTGNSARAAEEYRRVLSARGNHAREKDAAAKLLAALAAAR
jgi:arylsulfatase A-like enzyme/Flp pilus assembly protein TadD